MARGTSLSALRDMLRAEIGASSNVAMGVNTVEQYDHLLRRTQARLWADHDWTFGFIERDEPLIDGERYYAFDNEIDYDRISKASVKYGDIWYPMEYGITPDNYNSFDSDDGEASMPAMRWQHYEGNQFEVWPIPSDDGQSLRFRAIKKLPVLLSPSDVAILDDNLIVLFAAAELLGRSKATDAGAKLSQATSHYNKLKGNSNKSDRFIFGGGTSRGETLRNIGGRFIRDDL
jgi:hypothetical protein